MTRPVEARVWTYLLPLRDPLRVKDRTLRMREGVLVWTRDEDGVEHLAEAAPLPGYSTDALEMALHQMLRHVRSPGADRWWVPAPSVQCALDMLAASAPDVVFVAVNGLALGDPETVSEEEIARLKACGCVKIKVGRAPVADDLLRVRAWAASLGATRLRLDANQAWDLHDATAFARAIADLPVEYIEEPLQNPAQLSKFARDTGAPLALDETLQSGLPERAGEWNLRAVVLKPTALGGFTRARALAEAAAAVGAQSVVSSLFESSVGLAHLAHFAATLPGASTHHGLDTAGAFAADTLIPPLRVEEGRISAPPPHALSALKNDDPLREALHV